MQPGTRSLLKVIAAGNLIVFTIFLAFAVPPFWRQWHILRTWPAAEATVVRSGVLELPTASGSSLYDIYVEFAYSVDGRSHRGAVNSNHQSINRERKEKQAARFPEGSRHSIRYNPAEPTDIRAQVGYNKTFFAVPIFISGAGAIFGLAGAVLLWASRRR